MEIEELVRYYLLAISIKKYDFSKTRSIVNEGVKILFNSFLEFKNSVKFKC